MTGPWSDSRCSSPSTVSCRRRGQRENPRRQARPSDRPGQPGAVPRGKVDRLRDRGWPCQPGIQRLEERLEIADGLCRRVQRLVDRDLERLFERHHQLDPLERAQPELVDRRRRRDRAARREAREDGLNRASAAGGPAAWRDVCCPASHCRSSRRFSLRVPSVRGSSRSGQTTAARIF